VKAQELQENVFCASSIVECVDSSFMCLINSNPTDEILRTLPQTQELPKFTGKFLEAKKGEIHAQNQILQHNYDWHTQKKVKKILSKFAQNMWIFLNCPATN